LRCKSARVVGILRTFKVTCCLLSHKPLRLQIDTKVPNQPPNQHDTPALFKPIRRRYFPPHIRSRQANSVQHREQNSLPNSDKSCTLCNSLPVPTTLPSPPPHLTPKYTHLSPTATIIPFYGSIFFVIYYGTILRGEFRPRQTW